MKKVRCVPHMNPRFLLQVKFKNDLYYRISSSILRKQELLLKSLYGIILKKLEEFLICTQDLLYKC